jgi:hypothetical protein
MTQVFRFPTVRGCGHAGADDKAAQSAWARLAAQKASSVATSPWASEAAD